MSKIYCADVGCRFNSDKERFVRRVNNIMYWERMILGKAYMNADEIARSDMYMGDYKFTFDVTTTPLAKSLTALANWVNDGFAVFYNSGASDNG